MASVTGVDVIGEVNGYLQGIDRFSDIRLEDIGEAGNKLTLVFGTSQGNKQGELTLLQSGQSAPKEAVTLQACDWDAMADALSAGSTDQASTPLGRVALAVADVVD